jgi:hypothetical protein
VSDDDIALLARKTWRTAEPLHGMIYFVPEAAEAYAASRAAPMGAVSADVVIATFFNFNPSLVRHAIPAAWSVTTPEALVAARFTAADAAFRRILGEEVVGSESMRRASELARGLAEATATHLEGRPLCAGHVEVAWPEAPHLVLWHAQSILREFRGDAHVALLVTHQLSGIDALVTHAASGDVPAETLRLTRGWSPEDWRAAADSLRERDWLADTDPEGDAETLTLTEWGTTQRQEIEAQTDHLASAPYAQLGQEGCAELRTLTRPWSKAFSEVLFR